MLYWTVRDPHQEFWEPSAPPDDAALVSFVPLQVEVAVVGNGKDVWREFAHVVAVIELHLLQGVEGQHLEWVHGYQDGACVGLGKGADG